MLYFRFNADNFVAPQQEGTVIEVKDGKPVSSPQKEICPIDLGQVQSFFFKKLREELCLSEVGIGHALYDVIGIPVDAFSINDEKIGNVDGALKFVLSEYAKLPIEELNNKSLNDLGIDIEFCKRASNKEVNSKIEMYMQGNNLEYIVEDVLWKNMTDDEKVNRFSEYLTKIGSKDNELIIVDPYIFNTVENDYCNILASVLNSSKAATIIIVTALGQKHYTQASANKVSGQVGITMQIKHTNDFHDRFWIANRKKGFYTGTSFNGVGKRISLINMLSDNDVTEIIDELRDQSLIY